MQLENGYICEKTSFHLGHCRRLLQLRSTITRLRPNECPGKFTKGNSFNRVMKRKTHASDTDKYKLNEYKANQNDKFIEMGIIDITSMPSIDTIIQMFLTDGGHDNLLWLILSPFAISLPSCGSLSCLLRLPTAKSSKLDSVLHGGGVTQSESPSVL